MADSEKMQEFLEHMVAEAKKAIEKDIEDYRYWQNHLDEYRQGKPTGLLIHHDRYAEATEWYRTKIRRDMEHLAARAQYEGIYNPWYVWDSDHTNHIIALAKEDGFHTEIFYNKGGVKQLRLTWGLK